MQLYADLATAAVDALSLVLAASDPVPEEEDVKAGWVAFGIFLALAAAVAFLGWGLTRQLRRTEANRRAGAFGPVDDPDEPGSDGEADPGDRRPGSRDS